MSYQQENIDESLIKQFIIGDKQAFDLIYHFYYNKLFGFVYNHIKIEDDSKEIVQEVFVRLWENRNKIKNLTLFNSYIYTISYNSIIDYFRERAREDKYIDYIKSIQKDYSEDKIINSIDYNELADRVDTLINKLPNKQKEVFILSRKQHLSQKEISERLKISIKTVETHISRALSYLRKNLTDLYENSL